MIPGRSIIRRLLLGGLLLLPGCGADTPPSVTEKPGARSAGPPVDLETMRSDPLVARFHAECDAYLATMVELRSLETRITRDDWNDTDQAAWSALQATAARERSRLNRLMYAPEVTTDQRSAMWWLMRGEEPAGTPSAI